MSSSKKKQKYLQLLISFTDALDGVGGGWVAVRGKGVENSPGEARGELGTVGLGCLLLSKMKPWGNETSDE